MKILSFLALFCVLLCFITGVSCAVYDSLERVPPVWSRGLLAQPDAAVKFTLALPQKNLEELERRFWAVSDPHSEEYQNFMTAEEIAQLTATDQSIVDRVISALNNAGMEEIQIYSDALIVATNVKYATKFFSAQFFEFTHRDSGAVITRAHGDIYLDDSIAGYIELVEGIINFPVEHLGKARRMRKAAARAAGKGNPATDMIVPQFVIDYYNIPNVTLKGLPAPVSQGVIQWDQQYYDEADCKAYDRNLSIPYVPLDKHNIIGTNDPTAPGDESQMDIEVKKKVIPYYILFHLYIAFLTLIAVIG
jgi:subtilase family serine protease